MNLKFVKYQHYFEAYKKELHGIQVSNLLEIGIQCGGSLQYWRNEYPDANIFGIDIDPSCKEIEEHVRCTTFIGDQSSKGFLQRVTKCVPRLDVVIDDGGHRPFMQRRSFDGLWGHLKEGGVYVIEDLTKEKHLGLLEQLAWEQSVFETDIAKIVHYPQIVFIHKGPIHKSKIMEYGEFDCRGDKGIKGSTALAMFKFWIKNHFK